MGITLGSMLLKDNRYDALNRNEAALFEGN
jgi:hypothetical protein